MKNTFGRYPAAQKLETLLEDNPSARRKVSRLLSSFTREMFLVTAAKDPVTVRKCLSLLRKDALERINLVQGLSHEVRTYTANVVTGRFRTFLDCFNSLVPYIQKDLTSNGSQV